MLNNKYNIVIKDKIIIVTLLENIISTKEYNKLSKELIDKIITILNNKKASYLLIDAQKLEKESAMPRKTRQEFAKMAKHKNLIKIATVHDNIYIKVIVKSILLMIGSSNDTVGFFKTKKEAMKWLKTS